MAEENLVTFSGKVKQSTFEIAGDQKAETGETNGQVMDGWAHSYKKFPVRQKEKVFMFEGVTRQCAEVYSVCHRWVILFPDTEWPSYSKMKSMVEIKEAENENNTRNAPDSKSDKEKSI